MIFRRKHHQDAAGVRPDRRTVVRCIIAATAVLIVAIIALIPVGGRELVGAPGTGQKVKDMDLSGFSSASPGSQIDLLFIHHSVGGQWLAEPGSLQGEGAIFVSHPDGGGLRKQLERQGYVVHEASYGSQLGQQTDLFDWLPKFRDHTDELLACDQQDAKHPPHRRNRVVMFKSCFPNSAFSGPGQMPGDPRGPDLTLANAQATYKALLGEFQKHPDVLFVCVTTPPLAPKIQAVPLWKAVARRIAGRGDPARKLLASATLARQFASWLRSEEGWLAGYPHRNVVVFDYYDILTGKGQSDLLLYPTGNGFDSHPSAEGQRIATEAFVPFLNRAVRRAGLVK